MAINFLECSRTKIRSGINTGKLCLHNHSVPSFNQRLVQPAITYKTFSCVFDCDFLVQCCVIILRKYIFYFWGLVKNFFFDIFWVFIILEIQSLDLTC